ncbi:hypothetical protein HCC74_00025 [Lentilactobacillus parabuchneri]|uniref:hypothetical protein n=1 Tax=Lentilactobacillus parabuchneri TaxID=152331 RepID=UPI0018693635|nr:hypothetical protein [Lentilactobacillus parabuchneri]QOP49513.1 hypothetical protein HCC74_00025 [Lentilactobacillus parabuchneri]
MTYVITKRGKAHKLKEFRSIQAVLKAETGLPIKTWMVEESVQHHQTLCGWTISEISAKKSVNN